MRYVQGIYGWSAGSNESHNGSQHPVMFDGLSGSHVPILQAVDAFLGIDPFLSEENLSRHISINQRHFFQCLRDHCFRYKLGDTAEDMELKGHFITIVKQMRVRVWLFLVTCLRNHTHGDF
jgi:hypothetical protein